MVQYICILLNKEGDKSVVAKTREKVQLIGDDRVNSFMFKMVLMINAIMFMGYVQDCMSGAITVPYTIVVNGAIVATSILDIIIIKIKSSAFKVVSAVGYLVVYFLEVFGAKSDLTFVMIFPIIIIYVLYYDIKLINVMSLAVGLMNIADVIYMFAVLHSTHSGAPMTVTHALLQAANVIIFNVSLGKVTAISNENNREKLGKIQGITDHLAGSILDINDRLTTINEASSTMKLAMGEVNSGVSDTALAVQDQLLQTEEIQQKIEEVQSGARLISDNVSETMSAVVAGHEGVEKLVKNSDTSVAISSDVVEKLATLQKNMSEMNEITGLIDSIAFQTNIMALNANVEAARAGEAGRGFAVVASEISNMSDKTKTATADISELIANVSASLNELVVSINQMTDVIEKEKTQTEYTKVAFNNINNNTLSVQNHIEGLLQNISLLNDANRHIVSSVETISAASEEVMALTNQALEIETNNADSISKVARTVAELTDIS